MKKYLLLLAGLLYLSGCATNTLKVLPSVLPAGLTKGIKLKKSNSHASFYFPGWRLNQSYTTKAGLRIHVGESLRSAVNDVGLLFFDNIDVTSDLTLQKNRGLLITGLPSWESKDGKLSLTLKYKVYSGAHKLVHSGTVTNSRNHQNNPTDVLYYNVAVTAAQMMYVDINQKPGLSEKFLLSSFDFTNIDPKKIADLDNPTNNLSGISLNKAGYILGAYKDHSNCLVLEAVINDKRMPVEEVTKNKLLNLAVYKVDAALENTAVFGDLNALELGDPLVATSYSFKGNSATLTLSFANLLADYGFPGSFKSRLVSTAIQPASATSGFYDNDGKLVAIYSDYLDYDWMVRRKTADQNVYQVIEVGPVMKFLDREKVSYNLAFSDSSERKAVKEAKNNLIQIQCYQ